MTQKKSKKPIGKAKARTRAAAKPKVNRRLSFRELKEEKGIRESRMTIWRRIQEGAFPKPIADHGRVYWYESEIDDHLERLTDLPRGPGQRPSPKQNVITKEIGEGQHHE
jgi:predicted DNA-binding transcriptional regulator AlpA